MNFKYLGKIVPYAQVMWYALPIVYRRAGLQEILWLYVHSGSEQWAYLQLISRVRRTWISIMLYTFILCFITANFTTKRNWSRFCSLLYNGTANVIHCGGAVNTQCTHAANYESSSLPYYASFPRWLNFNEGAEHYWNSSLSHTGNQLKIGLCSLLGTGMNV